jgi:hypothetical protein
MRAIDKIVIGCYRGDVWLVQTCVASIRHWYPDRPIYLLKDLARGDFDTSEIGKYWDVNVLDIGQPVKYGTSLSKTELFFVQPDGQRILYIDSDILFVGPVVEALEAHDSDFIVSPSWVGDPGSEHVSGYYYRWPELQRFDPAFQYPGYVFNAGQMVITSGLIRRAELDCFYFDKVKVREATVFTDRHDQGVLNYLLPKLAADGRISLLPFEFKLFAHPSLIGKHRLPLQSQRDRTGLPYLVHYAGPKYPLNLWRVRHDLLDYFDSLYYSRIPDGGAKRIKRTFSRNLKTLRDVPAWLGRLAAPHIPPQVRTRLKTLIG